MLNIRFTPEVNNILSISRNEALRLYNDKISPTHLLLGIIKQGSGHALEMLHKLNADINGLKEQLEQSARKNVATSAFTAEDLVLDNAASRIMKLSVLESRLAKDEAINVEHVLLAILKDENNDAAKLLQQQNITYQEIAEIMTPHTDVKNGYGFQDDEEEYEDNGQRSTPNQQTATKMHPNSATPALDTFGTDLTKGAAEGLLDPVVGREQEIERVAQILSRRKKNNPILFGEPGVGKSAIVEGLALRIVNHKITRSLWDKRVVVLDLGSVVAGTKYRGQFEERMRAIILELQKNPNIIVFIDEIHTLIGAGSAPGTMDAANMLKPALARGEIQCVGATTIDEYRKSIEKDGALERRFQKVMVRPTTPEETLTILKNLKSRYEDHHNVTYTDEALEACVKLTERFVSDRCFPDKAIDAMDEAGARMHIMDVPISPEIEHLEKECERLIQMKNEAVKAQNFELAADYRDQLKTVDTALQQQKAIWESQLKSQRQTIDSDQVANVVSVMTGIPLQRVGQEENARLRQMASVLKSKVIGQDDAIDSLVHSIQRSRVGLKDPKRPIGVFMLVGPTGVGKTHLAKMLAEEMFGTADALIRIDMSEYMEKHTVSRMVGAPPGYVGYDEGGQLTEQVRRKPYSILLLDEIEKAHRDVFNLLLQVMDEGRLTDGNGTTIDFKNTIVIMTSNSGSRRLKEFGQGVGFAAHTSALQDKQFARSLVEKSLQKQFAPEFLNRLDDIIYFDQLSLESIKKIVDIELLPLTSRLSEMGVKFEVSDEAKTLLANKGYDVQYGARPLKRAISTMLEDPLCQVLLDNTTAGKTILATANGDKIELKQQ